MELIEVLSAEHRHLLSLVEKAAMLGPQTREGRACLVDVDVALASHLQREDREVYEPLREAAKTDLGARKALDLFARDIDGVTRGFTGLFASLREDPTWSPTQDELDSAIAALRNRVGREEAVLFPAFERLSTTP